MLAGSIQVMGMHVGSRGSQKEIVALYIRDQTIETLARTDVRLVTLWNTTLLDHLHSLVNILPLSCVSMGWCHLNAWQFLSTKGEKKKIKGYAVLFYYFYFIFRDSASESLSSPGRKGNGKLLLSLKLQGVSFIMKVQRQQQMCVASFSLFFFLCFVQLACCTE